MADLKDVCLRIEHKINDSIKPVPGYSLEIDDKHGLIILTVYEGTYTPYLYQKRAYRRSDSSTIVVDDLEYGRLAMSGRSLAFDMITIKDTELTFDVLSQEFKICLGVDQLDSNIMRTLGIMTKDGSYTNGALLLADENDFQEVYDRHV